MDAIQALILGLLQGLTEFLPVSSSGHLVIGGELFGLTGEENLSFAVLVHFATVLSTIVILWGEVSGLFKGLFALKWNEETKMVSKLLLSMIPVGIVGLFFEDTVELFFKGKLWLVGCMLLLTAALLTISYYAKPRIKDKISFRDAFLIGIMQACAVMPGLSRSGSTIATGIWLGNKKEQVAKFSFLMVILPVLGKVLLDIVKIFKGVEVSTFSAVPAGVMIVGFTAAFISGLVACKWMINVVKKGKLIYFAIYCLVVGLIAIFAT